MRLHENIFKLCLIKMVSGLTHTVADNKLNGEIGSSKYFSFHNER